jgi:dUTP pyrophosphatase
MQIDVINRSAHSLPAYQTEHSAGMDLYADLAEPVSIGPLERVLVPTGLFMALPPGHEGQVRPRSGLANQLGLTVLNAPGTIDADYRGEVKVLLVNLSNQACAISPGMRIAQLVVARHERVEWRPVAELPPSGRGAGGYGSTGH